MDKSALIVGVDIYDSGELEPLPPCKRDAKALADLLSHRGYEIFSGKSLIGSELTGRFRWAEIRKTVSEFFGNARPSQTLLFYFSGHGIPKDDDVYLGTPEVNPKNPLAEGFALSDLTKLMKESKSRQIVSVIDACYSGAARLPDLKAKAKAAEGNAKVALAIYDRVWERVPKAEGRYLLLSSQAYAVSWAKEDHSVYTKYLMEGLQGVKPRVDKDGRIERGSGSVDAHGNVTPESLHDYVYQQVASKFDQIPKIKIDRSSEIILATYPDLKPELLEFLRLKSVDLSKYVTIRDQGEAATDGAIMAVTAMEASLARQGENLSLSARYVHEKMRKHDEMKLTSDSEFSGYELVPIIYVIEHFGAPPESDWPYRPGVRDLPKGTSWGELDSKASPNKAQAYRLGSLEEIPTHLSSGRPILAVTKVQDPWFSVDTSGQILLPQRSKFVGLKTVVIVSYDSANSSIRFANSWGKNWGDNGFGSMSLDVARAVLEMRYMWAVEVRRNQQHLPPRALA